MKIRYRLTDPSLKDGAFLSAIFTAELITQRKREKENTEVHVLLLSWSLFLCVISSAVPPR